MGICICCSDYVSDYDFDDQYKKCHKCDETFCGNCIEEHGVIFDDTVFSNKGNTKNCPICDGKIIRDSEFIEYCCKFLGKTKEEVIEKIKVLKKLEGEKKQ